MTGHFYVPESFSSIVSLFAGSAAAQDALAAQDGADGVIRGETALWRAVITQALMDASNNSRKEEAKNERMQALRWLNSNGRDFKTICHYAGYDPSYIRQKIAGALERNCRWRAEPARAAVPHEGARAGEGAPA